MDISPILNCAITYISLVFVISVHEWAHAWTADKCGDPTARFLGRMTWNPLPHLDMIGTVIIPLIGILGPLFAGGLPIALIGWGKPVPVNPNNFRNYVRDDVLVSAAGPVSNVVITVVALVIIRVLMLTNIEVVHLAAFKVLYPLAHLSLFLAFFNLIPIPPLDGSHLIRPLLSFNARQVFDKMAAYGFILILVFVNLPVFRVVISGINHLFSFLSRIILGL